MTDNNNMPEFFSLICRLLSNFKGDLSFNYLEAGSQYVAHVDNQYFYRDSHSSPTHQKPRTNSGEARELPAALRTKEAMELWEKARKAELVDDHYQPLISRTESALLAYEMARRLDIRNKWKAFEKFWMRKKMYQDYYQALNLNKSLEFQGKLKNILN